MTRRALVLCTIAVVVIGAIAAALFAGTVLRAATTTVHVANINVGDRAPDFDVMTNRGRYHLAASSRPLVLELFATWCPHCREETKALNELERQSGSRVDIVAVSASKFASDGNSPESAADVAAFARQYGTAYRLAYDPAGGVAKHYLLHSYPTIVVIDAARRRIAAILEGEADITTLSDAVAKARR